MPGIRGASRTGSNDDPAASASGSLLGRLRYLTKGEVSADGRTVLRSGDAGPEEYYRDRWRHDRVVRSTHGVNWTGSCSW